MDYVGYTEEQARQAILENMAKKYEKLLALDRHKTAVAWVSELNLPYRVSLDYLKADTDIMEIPIQRWYPMPQIPLIAELSKEERINKRQRELMDKGEWIGVISRYTGVKDDQGREYMEFKPCEDELYLQEQAEIERKAESKAQLYYPWVLDTKEGIQAWEYLFAWRIAEYEDAIQSFDCFNMFGDTKHSEKELQERKAYYIDLIQRFKADTQGLYDTSPRIKQVADYELYDFCSGVGCFSGAYMWNDSILRDSDNPLDYAPKHPQALQIMQYEKQIQEQHNIEMGQENENKYIDRYSVLYRINKIIESLENKADID